MTENVENGDAWEPVDWPEEDPDALREKRAGVKDHLERVETELSEARGALEEKKAPYEEQVQELRDRIQKVREEQEAATLEERTRLSTLEQVKKEKTKEKSRLEEGEGLARWQGRIPDTWEMAEAWLQRMRTADAASIPYLDKMRWGTEVIRRRPQVDGFTVYGFRDGSERDKVYVAWDDDTGRVVGVLWVQPSQHPGDGTRATMTVDGQEVRLRGGTWDAEKPLKQFKAALARYRDTGDPSPPDAVLRRCNREGCGCTFTVDWKDHNPDRRGGYCPACEVNSDRVETIREVRNVGTLDHVDTWKDWSKSGLIVDSPKEA